MMLDGVIPHARAAARSFRAGQEPVGRQELCGSWPQLISGVGSARTGHIAVGHLPKDGGLRRRRVGVVAERAKGVVAAAG
jgi:hypothetical protein